MSKVPMYERLGDWVNTVHAVAWAPIGYALDVQAINRIMAPGPSTPEQPASSAESLGSRAVGYALVAGAVGVTALTLTRSRAG